MASQWIVPTPQREPQLDLAAVSQLLEVPRSPEPGRAMLEFVNRLAPVAYISLVSYGELAPTLLEGHAREPGPRNVTHDCWARYRRRYFGLDEVVRVAARLRDDQTAPRAPVLALQCSAQDIPHPDWRQDIYEREHLADRLTLVYAPAPRSAYSINLYRHQRMGRFAPQELERLLAVSPLLRQVHHQALAAGGATLDATQRVQQAEQRLALRAPALSPRERAVCARIACGISADGVAADLGVAASTVLTLRKRAYAKLGLHSRLALVRLAG